MSKNFWIIIAVVVVVFIGVFSFTGKKSSTSSSSSQPTNHIVGLGKTGVTLVEYGDYQCPYCGEYAPTVAEVQKEYNNQIYYQFVNFPLTSIHPNAFAGARAAESAGLMGQFWQMHNLLYEQNQVYYTSNTKNPTWIGVSDPESVFITYAKSLGLDTAKFKTYYEGDQVDNMINADLAKANNLGLNSTPSFLLDGKQVTIANNVPAFQTAINKEIAAKAKAQATSSTSK